MFLRPRPRRQQKPVALFFQVKRSRIDASMRTYPAASILQWYQQSLWALSAYNEQLEVVLVTNRMVDTRQLPGTHRLVVISHAELVVYLGPLAHRGLLAL